MLLTAGPTRSFAGPQTPAAWLVDLGHDYPLSAQASVSDADASITLLFMQAATRIDPDLPAPWLWQHDMLDALGETDAALDALGEYVRRRPEDAMHHRRWIELNVEMRQTAEERAEFLLNLVRNDRLTPDIASDVYRHLAAFHINRAEWSDARTAIDAAMRLDDLNFEARLLLGHLDDNARSPAATVETLLIMMRASPASPSIAIELGRELERLGLVHDALFWYRHAAAVLELLTPDHPWPELLIHQARALVDAGRMDEAARLAREVLVLDERAVEAHLLLARIERALGHEDEVEGHLRRADETCRRLLAEAGDRIHPDLLAEIAWFYAHDRPRPAEALQLARAALSEAPGSRIARRALGAAWRRRDQPDAAREALEPIADDDIWAAIELAQVLHAAGETEPAADLLRAAAGRPAEGEQRDALADLMRAWNLAPPATQPAVDEVRAMLDGFPQEVLDYPFEPSRFLSLRLRLGASEILPAEPWSCSIEVRNTGSFPITFGPGLMVAPDVLCTIETRGDRHRSTGPTLHFPLHGPGRLMPGESIDIRRTLNIGSMQASMIGTPQITHEVRVNAILSPRPVLSEEGEESWIPAVGGVSAEPLQFRRAGMQALPAKVREVVAQSRQGESADRVTATERLAMWLAEDQHLQARRLQYAVPRIDAPMVESAFLARARDGSWHVRARVAECMRWFVLSRQATQTASTLLADEHWLVRGLTLRMLADHHGEKFRPVLKRYAEADPDEWVQRMARALLMRLDIAAHPPEPREPEQPATPPDTPGLPAPVPMPEIEGR